jgi:hypothetical protein
MPPTTKLNPTRYVQSKTLNTNNIRVCPECAGPVVHNSGCVSCRQCGWGRCE